MLKHLYLQPLKDHFEPLIPARFRGPPTTVAPNQIAPAPSTSTSPTRVQPPPASDPDLVVSAMETPVLPVEVPVDSPPVAAAAPDAQPPAMQDL